MTGMDAMDLLRQSSEVEPVDQDIIERTVAEAVHAWDTVSDQPKSRRKALVSRRSRLVTSAGVVVMAAAIGGGAAAASGWFDSPPRLPAEVVFSNAVDPARLPGTDVAITAAGPDGTTFTVIGATFDVNGFTEDCLALRAVGPDGSPVAPEQGSVCNGAIAASPAAVQPSVPSSVGISEQAWTAPSGAQYLVFYGTALALPTTKKVSLIDNEGTAWTSETAHPGGYVIYLPANQISHYNRLTFKDSDGQILYTHQVQAVGTETKPPSP